MATIPTKKISELTTKTDTPTTETYVPVAEKSGTTFSTKKFDLQNVYAELNNKLGKTEKAADSDKLDGNDSSYYATADNLTSHTTDTNNPHNVTAAQLGANNILEQIKTVDGTGSGLDADLLDGKDSTEFAPAVHAHDANNVNFNDSDAQLGVSSVQEALNIIASRTQNTDFIYGIRWDYVNDIIQPGYVNFAGTFIPNDYTVFPIQEKAARVLLDNKGNERNLNSADSSKFPDGRDAPIDGSGGHTMVRIPKFYLLTYTSGNYHYILNSESPFRFNGYAAWIPPIFGNLEYRHIGAYEGTAMSDSLDAQVGSVVNAVHHPNGLNTSGYTVNPYPAPFTNRTRGQFRTQCNNGVFKQFSWGDLEILQILFYTKYKTFDSQAVLPGHTWRSAWDYTYTTKPGATYTLGNQDGYITDTNGNVIANSLLGVENFFGNIWKWVDGININNAAGVYDVYVCHDPANFADNTSTNYSLLGGTTDFGDADGYITNLLMNSSKLGSFFPTSITGGSSSEFVHDYMWNAAGGWRVVASGGALTTGASAGVAYLYAHDSSGSLNSAIGARLAGYV